MNMNRLPEVGEVVRVPVGAWIHRVAGTPTLQKIKDRPWLVTVHRVEVWVDGDGSHGRVYWYRGQGSLQWAGVQVLEELTPLEQLAEVGRSP